MRRAFKLYALLALVILAANISIMREEVDANSVKMGMTAFNYDTGWDAIIADNVNLKGIKLQIDGKAITVSDNSIMMSEDRTIFIASDVLTELFSCATNYYGQSRLILEKYNNRITLFSGQDIMMMNDETIEVDGAVLVKANRTYIPVDVMEKGLFYSKKWEPETNTLYFTNQKPDEKIFPYKYDYRVDGKVPLIKNQSTFGTCWAFAALTALETTLLPEYSLDFSEDHLSINNNFSSGQNDGGEYTMAMAYLASWSGPVLEEDDPYGDGISPDGLEPVVHVQEMQLLESKNYDIIKKAIFLYGGVQSSLYVEMTNAQSTSEYYNKEKYSYCYIGPEKPNHDVVIIGWDDTYSADNFDIQPDGDGAFICANSWGEEFGDAGIFYVSYYDSNIGVHNIVYTGIEQTDNYDYLYQTDLCGWVGQIGYNREYAYFANVYTAQSDETLEAVGFYATGADTSYEIYIVEDFENEKSFDKRRFLTSGFFSNAGYYTVDLGGVIELESGVNYAIVVYIETPNSSGPVAVEYKGDAATQSVIIDDGIGYISPHGDSWLRVEENKECNVCLKMYTNKRGGIE